MLVLRNNALSHTQLICLCVFLHLYTCTCVSVCPMITVQNVEDKIVKAYTQYTILTADHDMAPSCFTQEEKHSVEAMAESIPEKHPLQNRSVLFVLYMYIRVIAGGTPYYYTCTCIYMYICMCIILYMYMYMYMLAVATFTPAAFLLPCIYMYHTVW